MEPIQWLPRETNALIAETVARLEGTLGKNLAAVALVGAAMNPARGDRAQAPELLVVAKTGGELDLPRLGESLRPVMRKGVRVRIVTDGELDRSRDVFALEIAGWKARYAILTGTDVLAPLTVTNRDLRFGIELELRGLVRRMRNRIVTGIATDQARDSPREAIFAGYDRLVVTAHHALKLVGEEPPATEREVIEAVAKRVDINASKFLEHLSIVRRGERKVDAIAAFHALLEMTEKLIALVDSLETGA